MQLKQISVRLVAFLQSFELLDFVRMGVAILCFIPASYYIWYYRRTHVRDYLLYTGMWMCGTMSTLSLLIQENVSVNVIISQIGRSSHLLFFFLVFIYGMRMKWEHPPRILWYSGVIIYFIMQSTIIPFEIVDIPEKGTVLFIEMTKYPEISSLEKGVGLITKGGVIIIASGYSFISELYRIFALAVFVYVYLTTKYVILDNRVKMARNLWILAATLGATRSVLIIGHNLSLWAITPLLPDLFNLTGLLVIGVVTLRYPEAVLLSKIQLIRALSLYQKIRSLKTEKQIKEFGLGTLVEYLQKIPPEVWTQISN